MGITDAHWLTTTVLTGSLLLGTIVACAHDFVYAHYDRAYVISPTQQEWLGRFGTASAFLVKTLFSASVTTACVQRLWWTLRNKSISISTIDSSLGIVKNPADLLNWRLFRETPLIVLLAVFAWLMPLAALVTPSTLTVNQNATNSTCVDTYQIPAINYSAPFDVLGGTYPYFYNGPLPDLERVGLEVALTARPLPFPSPGPYRNASYSTQFYGPYLSCDNANQAIYDMLDDAIAAFPGKPPIYVAWTPYNDTRGPNMDQPINLTTWMANPGVVQTLDSKSKSSARLFVAALNYSFGGDNPLLLSKSVYECCLYNASYDLRFEFENGFGSYSVNNISKTNSVAFPEHPLYGPEISYISLFDALGQIISGTIQTNQYQQMFIKGPSILKTSLATTRDFPQSFNFLHGRSNKTLGQGIEELMVNITVSLFPSTPYLVDKEHFPWANVSVHTRRNIYHYSRWQLVTSYTVAAAGTFLCVLVGLWCLQSNSAAYANNFSTILRVTRYSRLDKFIAGSDTLGVSPTPEHIGEVKVRLERLDDEMRPGTPRYAIIANTELAEKIGKSEESLSDEDVEAALRSPSLPLLRAR